MRSLFARRLALGAFLLCSLRGVRAEAAVYGVYSDALQNGFDNWSWGSNVNLSQTAVVRTGTSAISFQVTSAWGALYLHGSWNAAHYDTVSFWIRGGSANLGVAVDNGAASWPSVPLATHIVGGGGISASTWKQVTVSLPELGLASGSVNGLALTDAAGAPQPLVYVDDVTLTGPGAPPLSIAVDPSLDRRAVSPDIYGVNWGNATRNAQMGYPVVRWGGNPVTRYNWQTDADNRAQDWFFMNYGYSTPVVPGREADRFIDQTRAGGAQVFLSVPIMGRVAKDGTSYSFPTSLYAGQTSNEGDWGGDPDKGSGCLQLNAWGGCLVKVTGNDPNRTSVSHDTSLVTTWMSHISTHLGGATAANGGQRLYGLDNEPGIWHETHHDVWKPLTAPYTAYPPLGAADEWDKTRTYAAAIKAQDPAAKILGPSDWLVCTIYFTAADGCGPGGSDWANHGSKPFARWYLQKAKEYEQTNGVRLVDYFDLHFYPQATGVVAGNEDSGTAAIRLRSIKSLYDPNYVDESWLNDLGVPGLSRQATIPTLKSWIAAEYPGTKLAIGEYNWGDGPNSDGNSPSGALAQAEVLAIFAREGVDLATRWEAPAANTIVEDAFKLYLNYDGLGHKVAGETCRATSSDVDAVGAYAQRGSAPTGPLYVLLFNKDTVDRIAPVAVSGLGAATASLYRFSQAPGAAGRLQAAGTATFAGGAATLTLPARSATLAVMSLPAAAPPATRFFPVTPCRLFDTRNGAGAFGGPAMGSGTARTWTASAGACGIPAGARSLSTNVTVTQSAAAGELRVYPADVGSPLSSAISFRAGATRANNALVGLSGTGSFTVEALVPSGSVHVILDVNGYFQ